MNKKKILVTGGAGFVGTNLIKLLLKKTNLKIISLDNYSSGSKKEIQKSVKFYGNCDYSRYLKNFDSK